MAVGKGKAAISGRVAGYKDIRRRQAKNRRDKRNLLDVYANGRSVLGGYDYRELGVKLRPIRL